MIDNTDKLVWDTELGWIDPLNLLGSLGIKMEEWPYSWVFKRLPSEKIILRVDRGSDVEILRACLDELERELLSGSAD